MTSSGKAPHSTFLTISSEKWDSFFFSVIAINQKHTFSQEHFNSLEKHP